MDWRGGVERSAVLLLMLCVPAILIPVAGFLAELANFLLDITASRWVRPLQFAFVLSGALAWYHRHPAFPKAGP